MSVLASLVIKILGDTAGIEAAVSKTEGTLNKIGKAADSKLGQAVKTAAKIGAGAVVAEFGLAINTAAKFEHAVDQVGAVANATEKEMKGLADAALRIGKDTAFSATEAAQAMEILAANGVSATDIMQGAADATVALAAAGGTDLKTAADTSSTAMAVWGLKTSEMTDLVNRLAGAANVSRFGVEDMSAAIAMGGGAAASAGVEIQDFLTSIAAIAPSFSSGSDAGTSFKSFLNALTPTTEKAISALKNLGIITKEGQNRFFTAEGQLKSMADITGILNDATKGLTEQQKAQALETIFGADAMRAAAALAGLTKEEFLAMDEVMKNTSAADVAAQRMGNLKGSMEELSGSVETLQIKIGMALIPVAMKLSGFLNSELVPAGEKLFAFLQKNQPVAIALAVALGLVLTAMFPIPTAIALVVVAGSLLINHWSEIRAKATEVFGSLPGPIQAAMAFIYEHIVSRIEGVKQMFEGMWKVITGVVDLFTALVHGDWAGAWDALKQIASGALDIFIGHLKAAFGNVPGIIAGFAAGAATAAGNWASGIVNKIMEVLSGLPGKMAQVGRDAANAFLNSISVAGISAADVVGFVGGLSPFAAGGVSQGGLALVGERGPEIVGLPRGARVFSNAESRDMARGGTQLTVNVQGDVIMGGEGRGANVGDVAFGIMAGLQARGWT